MPQPTQQLSSTEGDRIQAAYARRTASVPSERYSFFNKGHVFMIQECERRILSLLTRHGRTRLDETKVLEVGCGNGFWVRRFIEWGVRPENLVGVDLLPDRIAEAKQLCPAAVTLECGNAAILSYPSATFDLVLQSTVFTSILDPLLKKKIAVEMLRVLKPGGHIIWYDFRVNNPRNRDVRGVKKQEIGQLFPGCRVYLERGTLAPPIGRLVAPISPFLYLVLSSTKVFCTHYLGLISKE